MAVFNDKQIKQIVSLINKQLSNVTSELNKIESKCKDKDYLRGRKEYSVTGIVYNSFTEKNCLSGFEVHKISYGRGLFLPELVSEDGNYFVDIYNESAEPENSKYLIDRVNELQDRYYILEFNISKDEYYLTSLTLLSFSGTDDKHAKVQSRKNIYKLNSRGCVSNG